MAEGPAMSVAEVLRATSHAPPARAFAQGGIKNGVKKRTFLNIFGKKMRIFANFCDFLPIFSLLSQKTCAFGAKICAFDAKNLEKLAHLVRKLARLMRKTWKNLRLWCENLRV